jgi:hypothetical protein
MKGKELLGEIFYLLHGIKVAICGVFQEHNNNVKFNHNLLGGFSLEICGRKRRSDLSFVHFPSTLFKQFMNCRTSG